MQELHGAQRRSVSAVWDKNKRGEKGEKKSWQIKWGFTDLRCHLLYEVNGVIYVEADHTAQWNLWWWKEQRTRRTDRLITMALGRGHSFARKLIKTLFLGCFFVLSGASSHLLEYLETTWKKTSNSNTHVQVLSPHSLTQAWAPDSWKLTNWNHAK